MKKLITWSELYSVGNEKIDIQHKKLVDILNSLFNSFSQGTAENITPEVVNELDEYTKYHFKTVETIFEKYNYPEKENHIRKHKNFISQIEDWKKKLASGKEKNIHYELIDFLKKWIIEHLAGEDLLYRKFFKENNIEI